MLIPSSPPSAVVLIVNGFISTPASPASFVSPFAVAEVVVVVAVVGVVNVVATEVGDASFGSDVGADDEKQLDSKSYADRQKKYDRQNQADHHHQRGLHLLVRLIWTNWEFSKKLRRFSVR